VKADTRNPANVIVECALALTLKVDLLMKCFENVIKTWYRQNRFVYNGGLTPFFS
jgi:hypothetical protein